MTSYIEIKKMICRIFRISNSDINDIENDDIIINLENYIRDDHENLSYPKELIIKNEELLKLYTNLSNMQSDNMEICSLNEYEVAIDFPRSLVRQESNIESVDEINGITYSIENSSPEYCVYLLNKFIEAQKDQKEQVERNRIRVPSMWRISPSVFRLGNFLEEKVSFSWQELLQYIMRQCSLKIRSHGYNSINKFRTLKTSYIFNFMYRSEIAITEPTDIDDLIGTRNYIGRRRISDNNTPPLRVYKADVVDYYKLALSSYDPYIQYLSFYHILEYFFDEVFKRKIIEDLQDKITNPDFSYKDEDKVYDIANFIKNRFKMQNDSGQGNELETLKYVLKEYTTIEEIKNRINSIDSDLIHYYQTVKVTFSGGPTITWGEITGFYTQLAKRIYYTRNSLVHSKSGKNKERYKPYKDEVTLQKEIPLVQVIAEYVIINSSQMI